jgi:uncharacterized protein (TIGR03067 family)
MKRPLFPTVALAALLLGFGPIARADDLKDMAGKWKVETAEAGGKPIDSAEMKELVVTITGDQYEVQVKDKTDRGSLKLDEAQKPKAMDATDTEGDDVGKVIKAIYELKGDTLRVCYAFNGAERPTEFATKADVPILLVIYRREK